MSSWRYHQQFELRAAHGSYHDGKLKYSATPSEDMENASYMLMEYHLIVT